MNVRSEVDKTAEKSKNGIDGEDSSKVKQEKMEINDEHAAETSVNECIASSRRIFLIGILH